jgi:hypothetical protein
MKMKVLGLVLIVSVLVGCGKREDPLYFECTDGSGSQSCRNLDQQELAQYIETERNFYSILNTLPSLRVESDQNMVQTYLLQEQHFAWSNHFPGYYNRWDVWLHNKTDAELSCRFENYYGVLKEEGSRDCYTLTIFGREKLNQYNLCNRFGTYNFAQRDKLLYQEQKPGCY